MMNLIFETQRLRLRPITPDDLNLLHTIFVDPYVRKYLCDDTILTIQQVEEMIEENQKLFNQQQLGLWLIQLKPNLETLGFVGLWYFFGEDQPQLAYALIPTATKQGYATEASTQIIDYCFNQLGYDYLIASTDKPNLESQKLAERLGMRLVEERMINDNLTLFFRLDKVER